MQRRTVLDYSALARAPVCKRRRSGAAGDGAEASLEPIGIRFFNVGVITGDLWRGTTGSGCRLTRHGGLGIRERRVGAMTLPAQAPPNPRPGGPHGGLHYGWI